ncbi:MAG: hypothetical protein PUA77_06330 [Lachnospiraceae bacterium]|nr:hypothetical protein [Agathobacter sp.]MDD6291386.1 hypothetical protein [Lachnospiraceae bacterium]
MKEKKLDMPEQEKLAEQEPKNPEWATEALEEMDDFIESQGIYIRQ